MPATRRELLSDIVKGAAAAAIYPLVPRVAFAQDADGDLTRRIAADLARHAAFGDKFSGGPGDVATAQWIAGRLRTAGYRVDESTFQAPFFVRRTARLTFGPASVDVVPQAPVVPTGPRGVTGRLALVEGTPGGVRDRIALVVPPPCSRPRRPHRRLPPPVQEPKPR